MGKIGQVIDAMIKYYSGDARRINHFLKVYGFAKAIGEIEGIDTRTQHILEVAALTHDIGIKNSERKYNSSSGSYQQIEGPPEAKKLLTDLNFETDIIDRVCWLIERHHTYTDIKGMDYQILVEADFLVNAYEDNMSRESIGSFKEKIFATKPGKELLMMIYVAE
ncbi:MAG: HD domain-containing protein [Lachnospiraceae bacterium]|nr:HD domain-containing protein [Lachnospiraceae bacterium]